MAFFYARGRVLVGASLSKQLLRGLTGVHPVNSRPTSFFARSFSTEDEVLSANPTYTADYYRGLLRNKPLVVFMKGDPTAPMCGFSRLVVKILHMHGLENYDYYNVLEDEDFKEGMKKFSNWPTFPQVYMNSELIGGADIMLQMHQNGELVAELEKIGHKSTLEDQAESKDT